MNSIGTVESLWRYPVKSMRGEELDEMFVGFPGVYGDRVFAFKSSASPDGFPYFTAREQTQMLRYQPKFRHSNKAARPVNQTEAESLPPGVTPLYASLDELAVDVETPTGERLSIDDPALIDALRSGVDEKHQLSLLRSERALTDCRPVSIFAVQSAKELGKEAGLRHVDKRRFRANVYLELTAGEAFAEEKWVGHSLRIGSKVMVSIVDRDPRCMMITLDPDTGAKEPALLKAVAQAHSGLAGVYGAVLAEGTMRKGDTVELLDQ